jgi:hypothetical protein
MQEPADWDPFFMDDGRASSGHGASPRGPSLMGSGTGTGSGSGSSLNTQGGYVPPHLAAASAAAAAQAAAVAAQAAAAAAAAGMHSPVWGRLTDDDDADGESSGDDTAPGGPQLGASYALASGLSGGHTPSAGIPIGSMPGSYPVPSPRGQGVGQVAFAQFGSPPAVGFMYGMSPAGHHPFMLAGPPPQPPTDPPGAQPMLGSSPAYTDGGLYDHGMAGGGRGSWRHGHAHSGWRGGRGAPLPPPPSLGASPGWRGGHVPK